MKTYDLPTPNGISSISWANDSAVAATESPFSYRQQVYAHTGQRRRAGLHIPPRTAAQAKAWIAALLRLNGTEKPFFLPITGGGLQGTLTRGTPLVNGWSQTGRDLLTDGWTAETTVLQAGEWISIGNELHQVLEDVVSDVGGAATLQLWPRISTPWPDNHPIEADAPRGSFRLLQSPVNEWGVERFMQEFSLSAVEFPHRTREDHQVASFARASSQRLDLAHAAEFQFGTGDFTIALFARWGVLSDDATIFPAAIGKGAGGAGEWELKSNPSGYVSFCLGGATIVAQEVVVDRWYHHTITRSGTTVTHYLNGGSPVIDTDGGDLNTTKDINLGCADAVADRYFDGQLDCVGIWKARALTASEVARLYNGGSGFTFAGLPSGLLSGLQAYWDFDDLMGNLTGLDQGFDLTNINATTFPDWTE